MKSDTDLPFEFRDNIFDSTTFEGCTRTFETKEFLIYSVEVALVEIASKAFLLQKAKTYKS